MNAIMRLGPFLAVALLVFGAGCDKPIARAKVPRELSPLEVAGTTTVRGQVTYNGKSPPAISMIKPTKDADKFPAEVPGAGWYVDEKSKGVRYALVFLKPPSGFKMRVPAEAEKLPADASGKVIDKVQLGSPKGQFYPRIVSLHPLQQLEIINNSDPPAHCDAKLDGPLSYQKTFKPGEKASLTSSPPTGSPTGLPAASITGRAATSGE